MATSPKPYPEDLYPMCPCLECFPGLPNGLGGFNAVMNLCPNCGNKRCPGAGDHRNSCTGSNDPKVNEVAWERIRVERGLQLCACQHSVHTMRSRFAFEEEDTPTGCPVWVESLGIICDSCSTGLDDLAAQIMVASDSKREAPDEQALR